MTNIEKALSDYLGEVCGMRLQPHALTGLAQAAIAAMQPAPQEPVADAWRKFELWLFRECNEGTRRHLWAIFGLPVDEITNHGRERQALSLVKRALTPLYAGPTPPAGGSDAE